MAGKNIKNDVINSLVLLQNEKNGFVKGFPIFCFIIGDNKDDIDFFKNEYFCESDVVNILTSKNHDWEHIAVVCELFESRGDAKRNNFCGNISKGWHTITSGKGIFQKFIFLLKL